jgi:hypothetical protein
MQAVVCRLVDVEVSHFEISISKPAMEREVDHLDHLPISNSPIGPPAKNQRRHRSAVNTRRHQQPLLEEGETGR